MDALRNGSGTSSGSTGSKGSTGSTGSKGFFYSSEDSNKNTNSSHINSTDVISSFLGGTNGTMNYNQLLQALKDYYNNSGLKDTVGNVQTGVNNYFTENGYKEQMEAANARLKQAYEYQQNLLAQAKDKALREAFIKQQMVARGYPELFSAAGINGGAAQSMIARNNADYANQRSSVYGDYLNNLGAAGQNYQQGLLQNNENYLSNMIAYQQALEQAKLKQQYDLELLQKQYELDKQAKIDEKNGYKVPSTGANGSISASDLLSLASLAGLNF